MRIRDLRDQLHRFRQRIIEHVVDLAIQSPSIVTSKLIYTSEWLSSFETAEACHLKVRLIKLIQHLCVRNSIQFWDPVIQSCLPFVADTLPHFQDFPRI